MLTVLIATHNGAAVLPRTLSALAASVHTGTSWQLVITDNASTDGTPGILEEFSRKLPLTVVRHPALGKNAALNAALGACRGDLIVLVDDDVLPDPQFLVGWSRFVSERSDCDLFGGRIIPQFEATPPAWLLRSPHHLAMMFGERDMPEGVVEPGDIFGGNMAVRRAVFDRGFRFDEAVGPNGANRYYRMGSETEFARRVGRAGAAAWFARGPLVHHLVRPRQWSEQAFIDRAYRNGLGRAYLMLKEGRQMSPPRATLWQNLAATLPIASLRLPALSAIHLARGFADEVAAARSSPP